MALHTLATPGVYARDRSSLSRIGTVACTAILPPRCSANAGSKESSGSAPASCSAPAPLSLRGLTISAATLSYPLRVHGLRVCPLLVRNGRAPHREMAVWATWPPRDGRAAHAP